MPARRIIRRALALMAIGAATTALIAAAAAWRATLFTSASRVGARLTDSKGAEVVEFDGRAPEGTQYLELNVYERFGATFATSRLRPFRNYTPSGPPRPQLSPDAMANRWERAHLLPWLDGRQPWPDPAKGENIWVKASGWPFRSFVCTVHVTNAPNYASHTWSAQGGVILSRKTLLGWSDWPAMLPRIIPFRPLWPELLANTGLFGAAWAVLGLAVSRIRRVFRLRVGLCPVCKYDLDGLPLSAPCPECGGPGGRCSKPEPAP